MIMKILSIVFLFYNVCHISSPLDVLRLINVYREYGPMYYCNNALCNSTSDVTNDTWHNTLLRQCCQPCSCDSDCGQYGTCCPDYHGFNETISSDQGALYSCVSAETRNHEGFPPEAYWLISKCPTNYQHTDVKRKCEESNFDNDLELMLPVQVIDDGGKAYRNKYCADCNAISEEIYVYWTMKIECYDVIFVPTSQRSVVSDVIEAGCNLRFIPVNVSALTPCTHTIDRCNVTGSWSRYDRFIEEACVSHRTVYDNAYRNMFCVLCNGYSNEYLISGSSCITLYPHTRVLSFSAIFDFRTTETDSVVKSGGESCPTKHFFDPYKDTCREILCPPLEVFEMEENLCRPAYRASEGICYEAFLNLQISTEYFKTDLDLLDAIFIGIYLNDVLGIFSYIGRDRIALELYVNAESPLHQGEKAKTFSSIVYMSFEDDRGGDIQRLLDLDQTSVTIQIASALIPLYIELGRWRREHLSLASLYINESESRYSVYHSHNVCQQSKLLILPLLNCERVRLSKEEYNWFENGSSFVFPELNWTVRDIMFQVSDSALSVDVCVEHFIAILGNMTARSSKDDQQHNIPEQYFELVSLICLTVSEVSLFLTFITYCLFKELRTRPGQNNMVMVLCLFLQYGLFMFGFARSHNELLCKVIGVLIHFFTLSSVFWMNVCCFHMMRVFTQIRQPQTQIHRPMNKTLLLYAAYTTGLSVACVSANIVYSLFHSERRDIGYGQRSCYISSADMILYTMAVPALVVILSNVVMFTITVVTLSKLATVPSEVKQRRQYFSIYVKLSTLTGLAYILAIPLNFSYHIIIDYLYIIINASQGCFIFIAFICNKRIYKMYRQKLASQWSNSSSVSGELNIYAVSFERYSQEGPIGKTS